MNRSSQWFKRKERIFITEAKKKQYWRETGITRRKPSGRHKLKKNEKKKKNLLFNPSKHLERMDWKSNQSSESTKSLCIGSRPLLWARSSLWRLMPDFLRELVLLLSSRLVIGFHHTYNLTAFDDLLPYSAFLISSFCWDCIFSSKKSPSKWSLI